MASIPRWIRGYGVAAVALAAALANVYLLETSAPISSFILAIIASTWFAGSGPGLAALGGSLLALGERFAYDSTPGIEPGEFVRLLYFVTISGFIVWIITTERRSKERIARSERQLQLVLDTIPAMVWSVRADGSVEWLNRRWLEYSGLTHEQAVANPADPMHPDDAPRSVEAWQRDMAAGRPYEGEMRLRGADGEYRWFLVRTMPLLDEDGNVVRWYGTSADIEDRKRAEERLQQLSRRVVEIHEEDRRHFARELHDEFGQLLATINLHLHAARNGTGEAARTGLAEATTLLARAGERVRNLALELRPAILETDGLDGAVRWLASRHQEKTGMPVLVEGVLGDVEIDLATACFRVVQQGLTNIVQHANASRVWIALAQDEASLDLVLRDDGRGFDVARTLGRAGVRGHLGLPGMKERVELLGGTFTVESSPGSGTRLRLRVPLQAARARAAATG